MRLRRRRPPELPFGFIHECRSYALSEVPREACGLIYRHRGQIRLWTAENVAQEPTLTFAVDPAEQLAILERIWELKGEYLGIMHSHPRGSCRPSERDFAVAEEHRTRLLWVIVGLGDLAEIQVSAQYLP